MVLATIALPPYRVQTGHAVLGGILLVVAVTMAASPALGGPKLPADVAPLFFYLPFAILIDGSGGSSSAFAPVVALPVFWVALYGTRRLLAALVATALLVFGIPVAIGARGYPLEDWRRAVLWALMAAVIGAVVQNLVGAVSDRERKQLEVAAHLDSLLAAATEHSIIATRPDGVVLTFNEGAERMLGYRADEVVGRTDPSLFHDPAEVATRAAEMGIETGFDVFTAGAREGGHETREWTYLHRSGDRIPVRLTVTAIRGPVGEVLGFMGIAVDIRAEKEAVAEMEAAQLRWRVLLDHLPDTSVLVIGSDLRYRVAVGAGLVRQGMGGVFGRTLAETSSAANAALIEPVYRAALGGREQTVEVVGTNSGRVTEIVATPLPHEGGDREALIVARDVSEARAREDQLRVAEERASRLFDDAPYGLAAVAIDGTLLRANAALGRLLGRPPEAMVGRGFAQLGVDPSVAQAFLTQSLASVSGHHAGQVQVRWPDDTVIDVAYDSTVLLDAQGDPELIVVNVVDVSERRRYEAQLAHLADHDPLTGLANRRRFDGELAAHMARGRRYGAGGALMMLDLDGFKQVNDTLGHGVGDQLLVSVADLLRARLRDSDVVARLGGDEFAVLLPEVDRVSAELVAADIVRMVREQTAVLDGSRPRRVTASIGLVMIDRPDLTAGELMSTVDMTMYDAKEAGRDRYVTLDSANFAQPRSGARMAWADRIDDAFEQERFVLHAQPILDLATGVVTGAELLVRMLGDDGELIPPGRFLYIAERLGLITRLDTWVADQAIDLLGDIHTRDPAFRLEVNLSGHSVGNPHLAAHLTERIRSAPFSPDRLVFEITETAAVANIETARTFAEAIAEVGCRFALDDFGAGFGSFYYLKHLPFDYVKIDGEFVTKCVTNPTDRVILSSIVGIAQGLGKQTIAEYVADADILDVVRAAGVDHAQGYHIGRPAPLGELLGWTPAVAVVTEPTAGTGA